MKKFTKVCLITALVLILAGGTICLIGAAAGGFSRVDEAGRNGFLWRVVDKVSYAYDWDIWDRVDSLEYRFEDSWESNWEDTWGNDWEEDWNIGRNGIAVETKYTDMAIEAGAVTKMEISIGGAGLYVMESENGNFGIEKKGVGKYQYYESGGVLYLEGNKRNITNNNEIVYLYIPAGISFERAAIRVGGGFVKAAELNADEIDMEVGAGIITADKVNCRSLEISIGAGKATLKGIEAEELDMSVGVGHAYAEGNITKEINVDCGMGAVELELAGSENDYNYEANCQAGSIVVGNKTYAFSDNVYVDNDAERECSLECAMGNIRLSFKN